MNEIRQELKDYIDDVGSLSFYDRCRLLTADELDGYEEYSLYAYDYPYWVWYTHEEPEGYKSLAEALAEIDVLAVIDEFAKKLDYEFTDLADLYFTYCPENNPCGPPIDDYYSPIPHKVVDKAFHIADQGGTWEEFDAILIKLNEQEKEAKRQRALLTEITIHEHYEMADDCDGGADEVRAEVAKMTDKEVLDALLTPQWFEYLIANKNDFPLASDIIDKLQILSRRSRRFI